jgi:hypothetical protein
MAVDLDRRLRGLPLPKTQAPQPTIPQVPYPKSVAVEPRPYPKSVAVEKLSGVKSANKFSSHSPSISSLRATEDAGQKAVLDSFGNLTLSESSPKYVSAGATVDDDDDCYSNGTSGGKKSSAFNRPSRTFPVSASRSTNFVKSNCGSLDERKPAAGGCGDRLLEHNIRAECVVCASVTYSYAELPCSEKCKYCVSCLTKTFKLAVQDRSLIPVKCHKTQIDQNLAELVLDNVEITRFRQFLREDGTVNKMYW